MESLPESGWQKIVHTPEEMISTGVSFGKLLESGSTLALVGGLGAGKTHLTQGIAKGLGCTDSVTSPTFSLLHEYTSGRFPIYHFDFYRMESEDEVLRIGWDEYLDEPAVIIAEWADLFPSLMPNNTVWINVSHDGDSRVIKVIEGVQQ